MDLDAEASCESYRDETAPPEMTGFSIVNASTEELYLQPRGECGGDSTTTLVWVERDGRPINTYGGGCARSCDETVETSWDPSFGEGAAVSDCAGIDCSVPRVPIQPGETLFQAATREIVFRRMPRDCAEGITTEAVDCYSRVIPPRGNYTLKVFASRRLGSDGFEVSVPSAWLFDPQTITIALPSD